MPTFTIREIDGTAQKLELDKGFVLSEQRETTEGQSITVEYAGRRVVLRERIRGTIEAEGDHTRPTAKPRTGVRTLADAIEWAVKELHAVVRSGGTEDLIEAAPAHGIPTGVRTLAAARSLAYERRVWAHCGREQQRKYERQLDVLMAIHGPDKRVDLPWSQSDVDLHFAMRCATTRNGRRLSADELKEYGIKQAGIHFPQAYGRRLLPAVKPITAKNELLDIKVLFGYLKKQTVGGSRFLRLCPLDDLDLGNAIRGKRADYHRDRYKWLLAAADYADPTGQLRLLVVLAFQSAHRIDSILNLEMDHLGLGTVAIRALLRQVRRTHETEPTASEGWARHYPYGAIYWIRENDKENFDRVVPVSERTRREIDRYLEKRERMLQGRESRWLFPNANDPAGSTAYGDATALLRQAENIARPHIEAAGLDPDEIMPATPGDAWHPARGWWEARRAELLWEGNRNSAYVGGWTCNTGVVQSTVYGELDPRLMQACVEGQSLHEAAEQLGLIEEAKAALDPEEPVLEVEQRSAAA